MKYERDGSMLQEARAEHRQCAPVEAGVVLACLEPYNALSFLGLS